MQIAKNKSMIIHVKKNTTTTTSRKSQQKQRMPATGAAERIATVRTNAEQSTADATAAKKWESAESLSFQA